MTRTATRADEPVMLRCAICKREDNGTLPQHDRAGWDWFKGLWPVRVEVCPDCGKGNRDRHAELKRYASTGFPPRA